MPITHRVAQGESLSLIAHKYRFTRCETIWDDPLNRELKTKRKDNPDLLFPGDVLYIPVKKEKAVSRATDAMHPHLISRPHKILRVAVEDRDRKAIANAPYKLKFGNTVLTGHTDGAGHLQAELPVDVTAAHLMVNEYSWDLMIGHLNPVENVPDSGVSGIQARLHNLGYEVGAIDGQTGPVTRAAVGAFQRDHPPLKSDGICGAKTLAELVKRHGC